METRLEKELRFHIEEETQANIDAGMTEEEARRVALASFGSIPTVKEDVRKAWGWTLIEQLSQDLRYSARELRQSPTFTIVSVCLLGIGIGATSAVFTAVNAVFRNPLPVKNPRELRLVSWTSPTLKYAGTLTYGTFLAMRDQLHLSDLACSWHSRSPMGESGPVAFQLVTGNYFHMLGVKPVIGRMIMPEDDKAGSPEAAVISYRLWLRAYGGNPDVLNRKIAIGDRSIPIVGVMAEGFAGLWPLEPQDVMLAFNSPLPPSLTPPRDRRLWSCYETVGRLPAGIPEDQIRTAGQALLQDQFIDSPSRDSKGARLLVTAVQQSRGMLALQEKTLQPLRLLIVTSGIILLITCTNIAGLLLARGWARRQELATRLALGAARGRLIRQLVTESVVLSVLGGLFGIALAYSTAPFLPSLLGELAGRNWLTPAMTPGVRLVPDWSVLGLAILLALSTGILFGFLPALRTTQFDLMSLTKLRGSIGGSRLGTRTGKTLVCIQVSLSMLLLISAGLFGRTLINLQSAPIGYNPNGLLFVETDPSRNPPTFVRETLNILQTTPGVSAAAVSQWPLYNNALPKLPVCVRAQDAGENGMDIEPVSPRFFETWGVPLLSGRDFDLSQDAGRSAIVNDKFVKTFFANRNPIGQQIGLGKCPGSSKTIVGVVGDHMDRQRAEITPMVYVTYPFPRMAPTTFAVRTVGDARALVSAIRRLMQEKAATVDGDVMTGIAYVERGWRQERLLAAFLFLFGMLALLISCVGIYGLLAYSVTGRTEEIGIRMALGAQTPAVIRMITRESVVPVVAGILLGTFTFFAGVRWIESILFGISKSDPFTIIAAGTTLLLTAGIASVIPARRASRIDPMRALRSD